MEWLITDVQLLCAIWAWTAEPTRRELGSEGAKAMAIANACSPFPALGSDGLPTTWLYATELRRQSCPPDAQRWAVSDSYRLVGRDINRMIAQDSVLFGNYTIRALDNAEFGPLFRQYRPTIFQTMLDFDVQQALSTEEQTATARLREQMGTPFRLNIGIYHQQEFIGWSFGRQESAEKYYMVNTAILPQHQGKGIYSALLPRILGAVQREGLQIVSSRHVATNNIDWQADECDGFTNERGGSRVAMADQNGKGVCCSLGRI
jgi:GNAT superfamily N-acetyltransferase